jgi:hypothetical protein
MTFVYNSTDRMYFADRREILARVIIDLWQFIYLHSALIREAVSITPDPFGRSSDPFASARHQHQPLKIFQNTIVKISLLNLPTKLKNIRKFIKIRT